MSNPLTRKLELFGTLDVDDRDLLDSVTARSRVYPPHADLIREGEAPSDVHLVLSGFCCRYKDLASGRRQIFAFLLRGDFCDLNVFILKKMDHTIGTITASRIVDIPRETVLEMVKRPALARALVGHFGR